MSSSATSRVFHWRTRASVWRPTPRRRVCSSGPWAIRPGLDVESMHGVWLRSRAQALPTGLWTPRPRRGLRTGAGSTGRRPNCSVRRQTRPGRIGGPGQSNRRTFSSSWGAGQVICVTLRTESRSNSCSHKRNWFRASRADRGPFSGVLLPGASPPACRSNSRGWEWWAGPKPR